jgi:hypothetical protein
MAGSVVLTSFVLRAGAFAALADLDGICGRERSPQRRGGLVPEQACCCIGWACPLLPNGRRNGGSGPRARPSVVTPVALVRPDEKIHVK